MTTMLGQNADHLEEHAFNWMWTQEHCVYSNIFQLASASSCTASGTTLNIHNAHSSCTASSCKNTLILTLRSYIKTCINALTLKFNWKMHSTPQDDPYLKRKAGSMKRSATFWKLTLTGKCMSVPLNLGNTFSTFWKTCTHANAHATQAACLQTVWNTFLETMMKNTRMHLKENGEKKRHRKRPTYNQGPIYRIIKRQSIRQVFRRTPAKS